MDPRLSDVASSLTSVDLIPDVVPPSANFSPSILFSVVWPTGHQTLFGNELTREQTFDEPEVVFAAISTPDGDGDGNGDALPPAEGEGDATYTLVMCDPDAPSRADPKYKEFRHWVITGLKAPANSKTTVEANTRTALKTKPSTTPYRPPGPPPGSGLHRYIFLLFQEPVSSLSLYIPEGAAEYGAALEERRSWNAVEFGERYGLTLVGANYFLVKSVD